MLTKQQNRKTRKTCDVWLGSRRKCHPKRFPLWILARAIKNKTKNPKVRPRKLPYPPSNLQQIWIFAHFWALPFSQEGLWLGQTSEYTHRAISVAKYLSCSTGILQNWDFFDEITPLEAFRISTVSLHLNILTLDIAKKIIHSPNALDAFKMYSVWKCVEQKVDNMKIANLGKYTPAMIIISDRKLSAIDLKKRRRCETNSFRW